jgi:Cytochrome c, mono- and diheme variants
MSQVPLLTAATVPLLMGLLSTTAHAQENSFAQVERGRYAVATGNCQGCHTIPGEAPFSGGRGLETPFGIIYTPNITFDVETGLGEWSKDEFWDAMHDGLRRDGSHLYPAFPYPHFTKMPRAEVDAIYDYLATIPRVRREKPENDLPFPLNQRMAILGWKWMFFEPGEFEENPDKSPQWNRGAYLVEGPGHCAGCHTPKNFAGADKKDQDLQGGQLENWAAPSIRGGSNGGLEDWSEDDIVEFLRAGRNRHTAAFSTMAEVIELSTQHMTEADLRAIATYLKDREGNGEGEELDVPDAAVVQAGEAIYLDNCSACHTSDGSGVPRFFAPLAGSGKVNNDDATTVIRVILKGARSVPTKTYPSPLSMPAFDWKLTDEQIAAVTSYIRSSWGNKADAVTAEQVAELREALKD